MDVVVVVVLVWEGVLILAAVSESSAPPIRMKLFHWFRCFFQCFDAVGWVAEMPYIL